MDKQRKHFYEFGDFRLEPARRKFYESGRVVALTPKVFDLLVVLIENQGRVLEKRYLLDQVWSDVIVEEHSLTQAISVLRKILGDKPGNYNYIKTIPGRGYQFIAVVIDEDEPESHIEPVQITSVSPDKRSWAPAFLTTTLSRRPYFAATFLLIGLFAGILPPWLSGNASRMSSQPITSIAVKPLHAADKESCRTGLSGTLTNALVTKLSRVEGLRVRALEHSCSNEVHTNSRVDEERTGKSFESIRDMGTDAVIEGQVQKHAERFRVSVRLVRTSDGVALWADQVETGSTDDLSIEDRFSALVAEAILTRTSD